MRREDTTAVLVNTRLAVREPRRQGSGQRVADLLGLGFRPWAPPLPIRGYGVDRTVMEKRGLHVMGKTCQGLWGSRCTDKGRAAERREGCAGLRPALPPRLVDRALGLRLPRCGGEEPPALLDTPELERTT